MQRLVACALVALGVFAGPARAQAARATDARFYPFIGCWRGDTASANGQDAFNCIVPVQASADVELVDIIDGRIVESRRVDVSGRPHQVDEEGCRGQEQASWSPQPRRVYLHSEFTCAPSGIAGGKTTLMSVLPSGERLEVESIRSGVGSITRVQRFRDAGLPPSLPREVAARLGRQRLATMTARAEASSPLSTTDVVEALRHTDSSVVRAWLTETAQHFQLSGDQVEALIRADVPAPVLQAMLGAAPAYQLGVGVDPSGRSADAYLNSPGTPAGGAGVMTTAGTPAPSYQSVTVYDDCCAAPAYSSYGYASPAVPYYGGTYTGYNGAYVAPYAYYYEPYLPRYRRPYYSGSNGRVNQRRTTTPSYHSNPVGVRAGQAGMGSRPMPSRPRTNPRRR